MGIGPGALKVGGSVGALLACGASGLVVASNTKPADAPLRPPVDPGASLGQVVAQTRSQAPMLIIPQTPVCEPANAGIHTQGSGGAGATTKPDAAVAQVLQQYRAATTKQARQQVLQQAMQTLTADERNQLTALIQQAAGTAGQKARGQTLPGCRGTTNGSTSSSDPGIVPSTVDAPSTATPVTVSAVS